MKPATSDAILSFAGEFRFLSNFHTMDRDRSSISALFHRHNLSIIVPSVEHAYQAAKAQDSMDFSLIARCDSPSLAKRLGSKIELREGWDGLRIGIMQRALRQKFMDPILRRLLIDTGDRYLEERNTWGDRYWGRDERGIGQNQLGLLLMGIRSEIAGLS